MVWQSSDVAAGNEITSAQYNALRDDIETVLNSAVPIGTVVEWAGSSENLATGWLVCDGSAISRETYSDLYTIQGNVFGAGDGSTTFNLPDIRDRFVVGVGSAYTQNAKGGASSNDLAHTHTIASHTHTTPAHTHDAGTLVARIAKASQYVMYLEQTSTASWTSDTLVNLYNSSGNGTSNSQGARVQGATASGGASTSGGTVLTTASGGSSSQENRPLYIGLIYIIKAL